MKVLDLFAGLGGWGSAFTERGHEVVSVDIDRRFDVTLHADVFDLDARELIARFGRFDIVLASPPCEAFSVLQIGRNWTPPPTHEPKTDAARLALRLVEKTVALIDALQPSFWVMENPRAKLRKLAPVQPFERRTVTYCRFGMKWMKPTDLWGGFPPSLVLPLPCRTIPGETVIGEDGLEYAVDNAGEPCHIAAPRGSRTGVQGSLDWARNRRGNLTMHKRQIRQIAGTSDAKTLAALRAIVPHELSAAVCEAAERDLRAGIAAEPTPPGRLFP